ncbi:hypothetical protein LguiA_010266 [Lonicera macranthoides]
MPRLFGTWLRAIGKRDSYSEGDPWLKKSANEDEETPTTMRHGGNTVAASGGRVMVHGGELIRGKNVISNGSTILQKDSVTGPRCNPVINGIELANNISVDKFKENLNMSPDLAAFSFGSGTSRNSTSQRDMLIIVESKASDDVEDLMEIRREKGKNIKQRRE